MDLVIVADPITSKVITTAALADRLREEGHQVTVRIPPGKLGPETLAGFGLAVDLPDLRINPPGRPMPPAASVTEFQTQLAAHRADLYLIDPEAHEYVLAALAAGLPVALLSVFFNLWKLPGVPPVHQNVIPGNGLRGSRLGVEYGWLGYRVLRSRQVARSAVLRNDRRHHIRAFASSLGLDPGRTLTEWHGLIPFQYRELPSLTLNLEELELPGGVHPLNHYVGPMPNRSGAGMSPADQEAVLAEIDELRGRHPDRKLIYCAFGAYYDGDDLPFWRRAIQAVGDHLDWIGVFGLGGRIAADDLGPLPDNVRLYPWAPQMEVLKRADCAVIHAGMTSVYECIHHQVPMVVFPLGDSFDQYGTGARVSFHQFGAVGDRATATVDEIQALIERTINDPGVSHRLRTARATMERYRDDRVLTRAVEEIATEQSATSRGSAER